MQNITDKEFEREVEALKSHRRVSVNRPLIDPDLPDMAAIRGGGQEIMAVGAAAQSSFPSLSASASSSSSISSSASPHRMTAGQYGQAPRGSPSGQPSPSSASTGYRPSHQSHGSGSSTHSTPSDWGAARASPQRVGVTLTDEAPTDRSAAGGHVARGSGRQAFTARRRGQTEAGGGSPTRPATPPSRAKSPASGDSDKAALGGPSDPSHLFWVPASVHPEISPSHFREFLQEHASRAARERSIPGTPSSSGSASAFSQFSVVPWPDSLDPSTPPTSPISLVPRTSIARRGSTLRRQYRPDSDVDDDEPSSGASRPPIGTRSREGEPALSISDLQRLEALAEEASHSKDEQTLRSVLRRTMSLGAGTSTMDAVDAVPAAVEDPDAPIIVPPPGQILRRAARTKIRKSSMSGSDAERSQRISRRRAVAGQSMTSNAASDVSDSTDPDRNSRPDLGAIGMTLMQRRTSETSELSSGDEEGESARITSDGTTYSILDAYSRDSMISEASQRTSVTSFGDSETIDASTNKSSVSLQDRKVSPPETPTPVAPRSAGYFDLALQTERDTPTRSAPAGDKRSDVLFESPLQSPEHEVQPPGRASERAYTEPSHQPGWPVPVSHVPPVPSFEKTRPAPHPPGATKPLGRTSPAATPGGPTPYTAQQDPRQRAGPAGTPIAGSHSAFPSTTVPPYKGREREKKSGGFASWFGIGKDEEDSKSSKEEKKREKMQRKEKEREEEAAMAAAAAAAAAAASPGTAASIAPPSQTKTEKEKDVGSFLGALFGKKKGHDDSREGHGHRVHDGQITAGSLLDQRSPGYNGRFINNYYRYPIHVERAVYRLSHIKLANPRRPLYEQVLISNLMFWYLSIVNRSQQAQQAQQLQQQQQQQQQAQSAQQMLQPAAQIQGGSQSHGESGVAPGSSSGTGLHTESSGDGPTAFTAGKSSHDVKGGSNDQGLVSKQVPAQKSKKGGLVKPQRAPPGGRVAEMPIAAAAYGAQHHQINSDLAMQQQQQQQQQQQHMPSSISVGQVIDPRQLQFSYGQSTQDPAMKAGYVGHSGSAYDGDEEYQPNSQRSSGSGSSSTTSPKTSPGLTAQRIVRASPGTNTTDGNFQGGSGAWLGGGGGGVGGGGGSGGSNRSTVGPPVNGVAAAPLREPVRRSASRSPNSATDGEHYWLGGGGSAGSGARGALTDNAASKSLDGSGFGGSNGGMYRQAGGYTADPVRPNRNRTTSGLEQGSPGYGHGHAKNGSANGGGSLGSLGGGQRSVSSSSLPRQSTPSPPPAAIAVSPGNSAILEAARLSQSRRH